MQMKMNQLKPEHQALVNELTELIYNGLDTDSLFNVLVSFVENKYQAELKDVNNPKLRLHIIRQRFPLAFEESGLMDQIMNSLPGLNLNTHLDKLKKEQSILQSEAFELNRKIDLMVDQMTKVQINSFGRVLRLFDNRVIDLAKEEEEIVVIEKPNNRILECTVNPSSAPIWRTLQPTELLLGLRLTPSQPVLYRKTQHTWFPGRVISCHLPNTDSFAYKSDKDRAKENECTQYTIVLDKTIKSKSEICLTGPSSLALAFSAAELKQKYPVGARVVSIYRDDTGGIGYYSGLIAEPPSERNSQRYLLFFDDGYTQYSPPSEIYRICHQSKENWRKATESSQEFIKRYLAQYPQRPMVRLKPGQIIETELDGDWMPATVEKVDASLALMRFSRTHSEWIYRGSTRLEPLFSDLFSSQSRTVPSHNQRVEVEYNNTDVSLNSGAKRRKARKSATGNRNVNVPNYALSDRDSYTKNNITRNKQLDYDAVTKMKSNSSEKTINGQRCDVDPLISLSELEAAGNKFTYLDNLFKEINYKPFVSHKCSSLCLTSYRTPPAALSPILCSENPLDYKGLNPLEIPFHCGWLRYLSKYDPSMNNKCNITYSAPCGRFLRTMHEVERFLDKTKSQLTADLFSFDPTLVINQEFRAEKTLTNIADLSYGKENVPVHCVNSVDNEVPGYIDYIPNRQPIGSVPLLKDSRFLVCCDCTDNCRDRNKCACQQLTVEASSLTNPNGMIDSQAGYRYRRLSQFTVGGIYECNSGCHCDRRCSNRVVQQGLWVRLQVFKTSRKGWGIRALNAIPKGTFICTYAGAIYDETMAVQEGFDCGDEYQAELDYIETVEKDKEGYESTVEDLSEILNETTTAPSDANKSIGENKTVSSSIVQQAIASCVTTMDTKTSTTLITTTANMSTDNLRDESESDNKYNTGSTASCVSESTVNYADDDDKMSRSSGMSSSNSSSRNVYMTVEPLSIKFSDSRLTKSVIHPTQTSVSIVSNSVNNDIQKKRKKKDKKKKRHKEKETSIPSGCSVNTAYEMSSKPISQKDPSVQMDEVHEILVCDSPEHPRTRKNSLPSCTLDGLDGVNSMIIDSDSNCNDTSQPNSISTDLYKANLDSSNSSDIIEMVVHNDDYKNDDSSASLTTSSNYSQSKSSKVSIIFNGNDKEHIKSIRSRCTVKDVLEEISETFVSTRNNLEDAENDKQFNLLSNNHLDESSQSIIINDTELGVTVKGVDKEAKCYKPIKPKVQVNLCPVVEKEDALVPSHYYAKFNRIKKCSTRMRLKKQSKKSLLTSCIYSSTMDELSSTKNELKTFWLKRAASLQPSFRLLRNATQLLREVDFSRVPIVQLSPLQNAVKREDDCSSIENKKGELTKCLDDPLSNSEIPTEEKKDIKVEDCVSSTYSVDCKKSANIQKSSLDNDSQLDMKINNSSKVHTSQKVSNSSSSSSLSKHKGSFTTVQLSNSSRSKRNSLPNTNLSDKTDENITTGRELRSRVKAQRSASLEPEIKDRKSVGGLKSHQRESERQSHHRHHHHHLRPHHHRHHHYAHQLQQQQQQSQAHQQNQQLNKRVYPVAQKDWLHARSYFNDINPYIMDAKKMGNLGRYFNHSCNPNVFVQNVFIDTHDPRFPEVAFFTKRNIDVGEEMTWDYGYTVDAVPYKVLYCYCGEPNCRIRLL
ncbi:unnamed protein product [Heterobilharzia americana]|nr:unnamed protein product [Heterobilharzia americana]